MNDITRNVPAAEAAKLCGVCPGTLRNWRCCTPPRGPQAIKLGSAQQSRCVYRLEDIKAWQTDPKSYERRTYRGRSAK